jgi:hypothetical protein
LADKKSGVHGVENRVAAGHNRDPIDHDYDDLAIVMDPKDHKPFFHDTMVIRKTHDYVPVLTGGSRFDSIWSRVAATVCRASGTLHYVLGCFHRLKKL